MCKLALTLGLLLVATGAAFAEEMPMPIDGTAVKWGPGAGWRFPGSATRRGFWKSVQGRSLRRSIENARRI